MATKKDEAVFKKGYKHLGMEILYQCLTNLQNLLKINKF